MNCCPKCNSTRQLYKGGGNPHFDRYIGWCKDCLMRAIQNESSEWLKDQYRAIFG